jgi:hypothetical protein
VNAVRPGPWAPDHVVRFAVGNAVGFLLIAVGWWQLADLGVVRDQLAWFVVALVGLGVAGVTNGIWLLRGQRAVTAARTEMADALRSRRAEAVAAPAATNGHGYVSAPTTARYHRVGCALVAGRAVESGGRPTHEAAGRRPCEACRP